MVMDPTLATYQRIYLQIRRGSAGRYQLVASMKRPSTGALVALISQGSIARDGLVIDIVSDPSQDPTLTGPQGVPGKDGAVGAPGKDGVAGAAGKDGANGAPGRDGTDGKNASAYLSTISVGQTATVAIAAGPRRLALTIPASLGVQAGDSLYLAPTQVVAGYVLHDVVAVSSTQLSIGLTGPLLAIGASFSISCKLFRLNA